MLVELGLGWKDPIQVYTIPPRFFIQTALQRCHSIMQLNAKNEFLIIAKRR